MALDLTSLVPIYQYHIDSVISQLGKDITLYFKSTISNIDQDSYDPVRGEETRKPSFDDTSTVTYNTKIIRALIRHFPADFETFGQTVKNPQDLLRVKTYLTYAPDLLRCEYLMANNQSEDLIQARYRMVRSVVPQGLQIDRYCISFWERV